MVNSSALPELALWKAWKRLFLLGNERNGHHGCVNEHVGSRRALRQVRKREQVKREMTWVVHRFQLLNKQAERPKKWDLALQECRDRLALIWHRTVYKRLMMFEHYSHIAYIHALETVMRSRIDAYNTAMNENEGHPRIDPGGPTYPGQTELRDRTVRIIVLRPEAHYAVDAQGVIIPIVCIPPHHYFRIQLTCFQEAFHPRRQALGLDPPMGVQIVYLAVAGRFDLYNLLHAWCHHNPLGNRPNPMTIHGQRGLLDPTNPAVALDYVPIFRPMDFYGWVRDIEQAVGLNAAWPDEFFPTLRFVLHPANFHAIDVDRNIIDDHLRKYPTFELWAERSGIALPLPQVTVSPSDLEWRLWRCPQRNPPVLIAQHQEVRAEVDPDTLQVAIVQQVPMHNRRHRHREKVPKRFQADSELSLTDYNEDPNLDRIRHPSDTPFTSDSDPQADSSSDSDGFN